MPCSTWLMTSVSYRAVTVAVAAADGEPVVFQGDRQLYAPPRGLSGRPCRPAATLYGVLRRGRPQTGTSGGGGEMLFMERSMSRSLKNKRHKLSKIRSHWVMCCNACVLCSLESVKYPMTLGTISCFVSRKNTGKVTYNLRSWVLSLRQLTQITLGKIHMLLTVVWCNLQRLLTEIVRDTRNRHFVRPVYRWLWDQFDLTDVCFNCWHVSSLLCSIGW